MTHIIGWKNSRSIFICGDSAITTESLDKDKDLDKKELKSTKSTFGEKHYVRKGKVIQEKVLKLYNINDKLILGFAGTAHIALDIIDLIKRDLNHVDSSFSIEQLIITSVWCQKLPKEVCLIAGYYDKDEAVLMSYNHDGMRKFTKHESLVSVGCLDPIHKEASEYFSNFAIENEDALSDDESLLLVNTVHQGMLISGNLIKEGVGGFFTGLYINPDGVNWQKDTSYITFDIDPVLFNSEEEDPNLIYTDAAFINLGVRDNRITIESPYSEEKNKINIYKNYLRRTASSNELLIETKKDEVWEKKWRKEIKELIATTDSEYYSFICKNPEVPIRLTLVTKHSNEEENWFDLEKLTGENGRYVLIPQGNFIDEFKPQES